MRRNDWGTGLRGNALPETVFVMSLLMLLIFGALNLALIGYSQVQADGGAFIAARSAALASPSAGPAAAVAQVNQAFPHVQPTSITVSIANGTNYTTTALVTVMAPGLPRLAGGNSAPVRAFSHIDELDSNTGTPPPSGLAYSIPSSTLINYVDPTTNSLNSTHQAKLAAAINTFCVYNADGSSSSAVNSNSPPCWEGYMSFDDICQHDGIYVSLNSQFQSGTYHNKYAKAQGDYAAGKPLSPLTSSGSNNYEYRIAQWDAGTAPSSSGTCSAPSPYYVAPDIPL